MPWVDFRQLRKSLDFEKVLVLYGVVVKKTKDNRHQGFCPLPTHHGKRKTPSFSGKIGLGSVAVLWLWRCAGNVLEFAAAWKVSIRRICRTFAKSPLSSRAFRHRAGKR